MAHAAPLAADPIAQFAEAANGKHKPDGSARAGSGRLPCGTLTKSQPCFHQLAVPQPQGMDAITLRIQARIERMLRREGPEPMRLNKTQTFSSKGHSKRDWCCPPPPSAALQNACTVAIASPVNQL